MNAQLDGFRRQLEAIVATLPDSRVNIPDQVMAQLVARGLRRESIEQFAAQSMQPIETMDATLAHTMISTWKADRLQSRRAKPSTSEKSSPMAISSPVPPEQSFQQVSFSKSITLLAPQAGPEERPLTLQMTDTLRDLRGLASHP